MRKLVFLFLIIVFAGCKKEKLKNDIVEGNWKWEITYSCVCDPALPGVVSTPLPGENYVLSFNTDKTFSYTKNDFVLRSGTYKVKQEPTHTGSEGWFLYFSDQASAKLISLTDTGLSLGSDAVGAGSEQYSRIP